MRILFFRLCPLLLLSAFSCDKKMAEEPPVVKTFTLLRQAVNDLAGNFLYKNCPLEPIVQLDFSEPLAADNVVKHVQCKSENGVAIDFITALDNEDSSLFIQLKALRPLEKYYLSIYTTLVSKTGKTLGQHIEIVLQTQPDFTQKFPTISDDSLLTLVQRQTFRYFWDFGHPVSGLSRERNTSGDIVTSGGSGFGVMAMLVGIHRGFITRGQGLDRLKTIVGFLKNNTKTYHGAFPHWLNGATGATVPFSAKDDGADLVETSYLMQGLLCARQYFNGNDAAETALRADINALFRAVEWSWFTRGGQNVLYWHWSERYDWQMNHPIQGWNEALITYVMAAASPTFSIEKPVYDQGWARNGAMKNGSYFHGYFLPLGNFLGGPLFFAHYSFLGINPNGLSDAYADYEVQTRNHTLINYTHCKINARGWVGYGPNCWGLTASDTYDGYTAHEPTNDRGVISPTAAVSSMPYTPAESMDAMRFFYFFLGDKIWGEYGFIDAFSLDRPWFSNSYLAIDQGPMIIMIENHRSGLLWNLFTSCPEVKSGMKKLGFTAPYLP